jgi:hypothetical protein
MSCNEIGKYTLIPCCPSTKIVELCIDQRDEPIENGVYLYTGVTNEYLINGLCYSISFDSQAGGPTTDILVPGDFVAQLDCNGPECGGCSNYYTLTSCCDSEESFDMYIDPYGPKLSGGVYTYTGLNTENLKTGYCYLVEKKEGEPSGEADILVPELFDETDYKSCEDIVDPNLCNCNNAYVVRNCFDQELEFSFITEDSVSVGDVIELDLSPGDQIVLGDDNLCITAFRLFHPEINDGNESIFDGIAYKQPTLYNGRPYYLFTLTEAEHGVPGLVLNFYFIWNLVELRWEIWPELNLFTGPSNSACSENVPFMILISGFGDDCSLPTTTSICNYCNACVDFDVETCNYYISGVRDVVFCGEFETIGDFINCWEVIGTTQVTNTQPTLEIVQNFEGCSDCLTEKNQPPCIQITDCDTGTVIYLTATETLLEYVGKVIKVQLGIYERCYTVALSDICPEEPTALAGIIIDCFTECEDCTTACVCTRARNNASFPRRLEYLDCNNVVRQTDEVVGAGKVSQKYCVYRWISEEVEVLNFGDCVDNSCPEPPRPKRVVTPGYNTPACTPEHYERIVCRYAENKYKEVMEERFGIANCCPDDYLANEIKYELIHLQMLLDPDYECSVDPNPCNCHGTGLITVREINCNS